VGRHFLDLSVPGTLSGENPDGRSFNSRLPPYYLSISII
jgi:hypothetical protein